MLVEPADELYLHTKSEVAIDREQAAVSQPHTMDSGVRGDAVNVFD
jgi:hypothetical protein